MQTMAVRLFDEDAFCAKGSVFFAQKGIVSVAPFVLP